MRWRTMVDSELSRSSTASGPLSRTSIAEWMIWASKLFEPASRLRAASTRPAIGQWACENITHAFTTLAASARLTLHVDVLKGINDHHRAEAAFKSLGLALREAVRLDSTLAPTDISNSTKGVL